MNFHKRHNESASTSNAIATGAYNNLNTYIFVVRNIFYDNDHAILLKEDAFLRAENNVFVSGTSSALNFSEQPFRSVAPGKGALVDGCIFLNNPEPFENQFAQPGEQDPEITVHRSIIQADKHYLGEGNLDGDPQFVDATGDFHLAAGSPAIGMGPNGLDMGAYVPAGVSISGEPDSLSNTTDATLTVGGPGITHYIYAVNDTTGPWSEELSIEAEPQIQLTDLADGQSYTVYVKGKNSANVWQHNPEYATSKTWIVDLNHTNVGRTNTQGADLPKNYFLHQNFPNPFNQSTIIKFDVPEDSDIRVTIYDLLGREVRKLAEGFFEAGIREFAWNGLNDKGSGVSTGIYIVQIKANKKIFTRKMLLLQ